MTANPVPGLVIGAKDPPETVNSAIRRWSQQVSPVMYGATSPLVGTLPVPAAPANCYLMQTGSPSLAFSTGETVLTFPHPFPNGLLSFTATVNTNAGSSMSYQNPTLADIDVILYISGSAYTGTAGFSFMAIGW